jgi:uncharacterized membrane protein
MRARTYRSLLELGALLGLLVALFAALEVYVAGLSNVCSFNSVVSCTAVLLSGKTTTLWVPDWVWGVAGFIAIIALAAVASQRRKDVRLTYGILALTTAGVGLAAYFLYVEVFEIHAVCPVCVSAYFFGTLAWVGAVGLARSAYRRDHRSADPPASPG